MVKEALPGKISILNQIFTAIELKEFEEIGPAFRSVVEDAIRRPGFPRTFTLFRCTQAITNAEKELSEKGTSLPVPTKRSLIGSINSALNHPRILAETASCLIRTAIVLNKDNIPEEIADIIDTAYGADMLSGLRLIGSDSLDSPLAQRVLKKYVISPEEAAAQYKTLKPNSSFILDRTYFEISDLARLCLPTMSQRVSVALHYNPLFSKYCYFIGNKRERGNDSIFNQIKSVRGATGIDLHTHPNGNKELFGKDKKTAGANRAFLGTYISTPELREFSFWEYNSNGRFLNNRGLNFDQTTEILNRIVCRLTQDFTPK